MIGAGSILKNCQVAERVEISPYTVAQDSRIERGATIGPFARLRSGNHVEENAHIGNFVELKKTRLGAGAKAGHLAYLGDSEIGARFQYRRGNDLLQLRWVEEAYYEDRRGIICR